MAICINAPPYGVEVVEEDEDVITIAVAPTKIVGLEKK